MPTASEKGREPFPRGASFYPLHKPKTSGSWGITTSYDNINFINFHSR
jgi:hypothetical protein